MKSALAALFLLVVASGVSCLVGACASKSDDDAPARSCGLVVWHKPQSHASHVEIVGDWDGWKRPGYLPAVREDGWTVSAFDHPPGEHAYAIVEDGVWLLDKNVPMTSFSDDREVSMALVPDCGKPIVRVEEVKATASSATVRASFLAAGSHKAIDPSSVTATARDGSSLSVTNVDPKTGTLVLDVSGLTRGKYTYSIGARDAAGIEAEPAVATVWIEPTAWDPKDAIIYQVLVDRFRGNAGALAPPATPADRAGGTLNGVRAAMEEGYFERLGVNTLWLSPLYTNPGGTYPGADGRPYTSYHGYWPTESEKLDERFASEADLDAFMAAAHARSMRVLFDVVPNHVHENHAWTKEHPDWFKQGCVCGQGSCDWGTHVKTCWFAPYLPDLDWTNTEAARAQTHEVMWWFDRWGADGLRIDAVPMMPRAATRRITNAVRTKYEHAGNIPYVLGENFTGPGGYDILRYDLGPFGLDGSFNFPMMWTLRSALASESVPMGEIDASFRQGLAAWDGSGAVMGSMIGNHDVSRFASVAAGNDGGDTWLVAPQPIEPTVYAKQRVALAAVLTYPGAPVLYYGDEVGLAGRSDPDCRHVMPAESALMDAQVATREMTGKIGRARACSAALRRGDLVTLLADAEHDVFARTLPTGEIAVVALTRRPTVAVDVPLPSSVSLVDAVTGKKLDGPTLRLEPDAFGVHVWVAAGCGL